MSCWSYWKSVCISSFVLLAGESLRAKRELCCNRLDGDVPPRRVTSSSPVFASAWPPTVFSSVRPSCMGSFYRWTDLCNRLPSIFSLLVSCLWALSCFYPFADCFFSVLQTPLRTLDPSRLSSKLCTRPSHKIAGAPGHGEHGIRCDNNYI